MKTNIFEINDNYKQLREAIKLCYEVCKNKYDDYGVPEAFYALNIYFNENGFSNETVRLLYYILRYSDLTVNDLIAKGFDKWDVYDAEELQIGYGEDFEHYYKRISGMKSNRNNVITNDLNIRNTICSIESENESRFLERLLFRYCVFIDNEQGFSIKEILVYDRDWKNVTVNYSNEECVGHVVYTIPMDNIDTIYDMIQTNSDIERLEWDDYNDDESWMVLSFYKYREGIKVCNYRTSINMDKYDKEVSENQLQPVVYLKGRILEILSEDGIRINDVI